MHQSFKTYASQKCNHWQINVNPLLICEEASLIFRRLEVVHSLPPVDNSKSSQNQTSNQMRWLSLLSPGHARGAGGRGFKWGALLQDGSPIFKPEIRVRDSLRKSGIEYREHKSMIKMEMRWVANVDLQSWKPWVMQNSNFGSEIISSKSQGNIPPPPPPPPPSRLALITNIRRVHRYLIPSTKS